ncbi:hypothetical protein FQN54_000345 [Arachnomyces sp. PD_36]|nr:hypothetical protein FQN54_000345 [Arachnomyces sp. PD_36]
MIPPCDPSILSSNPQFKSLHTHLTTAILDSDGCDRAVQARRERKGGVREELRNSQIRYAKMQILKRVVGRVAGGGGDGGNGLPDELQDLLAVIALYLHHDFDIGGDRDQGEANSRKENEEFLELFRPDLDAFRGNIRVVAPAVGAVLGGDVRRLRGLVDVSTGSGSGGGVEATRHQRATATVTHRRGQSRSTTGPPATVPVSKLLGERIDALRRTQMEILPDARRDMTVTGAAVLGAQREFMERVVEVLERVKGGGLARAGKVRGEHLARVAEGMEGKVRIVKRETLSSIYTPDTVSALTRYREHLRDTRMRLEEKEKEVMGELRAYESADDAGSGSGSGGGDGGGRSARERNRNMGSGPGVMVEIARRYGALVKEVEGVRMEIRRLGGDG